MTCVRARTESRIQKLQRCVHARCEYLLLIVRCFHLTGAPEPVLSCIDRIAVVNDDGCSETNRRARADNSSEAPNRISVEQKMCRRRHTQKQ